VSLFVGLNAERRLPGGAEEVAHSKRATIATKRSGCWPAVFAVNGVKNRQTLLLTELALRNLAVVG